MINLSQILCPIDLSDHSEDVVDAAVQLADQFQAKLTLLSVVEDSFPYTEVYRALSEVGISDVLAGVSEQIGKDLREVAERHRDPAVPVDTMVLVGNPAKVILATAEELKADVVVMGSIGRSALDVALLGSVVEKVVRKAPCHVLIVRPAAASSDG